MYQHIPSVYHGSSFYPAREHPGSAYLLNPLHLAYNRPELHPTYGLHFVAKPTFYLLRFEYKTVIVLYHKRQKMGSGRFCRSFGRLPATTESFMQSSYFSREPLHDQQVGPDE